MKRPLRDRLRRGSILLAYGFVGSLVFMRFLRGQPVIDDGDLLTAVLVALFLAVCVSAIEILVLTPTRRMKLVPAVLVRVMAYTVASVGSVFLGVLLANVMQDGWERALARFAQLVHLGEVTRGSVYALVIVLIVVFLSSVSQKLGPGVLKNWLLGRYHEPRQERCVFMFLDMRNSTGLAEKLGDLRYSELVRDVFYDITPALLDNGARVSHFIGDEVVLYWPIPKNKQPDDSFARCIFAVQNLVSRKTRNYRAQYSVSPSFKAGAHFGTVIATDVGQIKSEIVFYGDVLNVASRLQGMCGETQADLLVSEDLATAVRGPSYRLTDLGEQILKGREQSVRVFSVQRAD